MKKRSVIIIISLFIISGCYVSYPTEVNKSEVYLSDIEQEKLLKEIIDYLKKAKRHLDKEMVLDSNDLQDTIFITTRDTTLCGKKYFYYNNIITPTNSISPCDYPDPKGGCLKISFEFLSYKKVEFVFNKKHGGVYNGYFKFFEENNKRIFHSINYSIGSM